MKKPELGEPWLLAKGHSTNKWQAQDLKPVSKAWLLYTYKPCIPLSSTCFLYVQDSENVKINKT